MEGSVNAWVSTAFEEAQRAHPGVAVSLEAFAAHVDQHEITPEDLVPARAAELLLACGAAEGDAEALQVLESKFLVHVPMFLSQGGMSAEALDEVRQKVRERLFVDGRIRGFSGKGSLMSWLRVVVVRTASNHRRADRPHAELDLRIPGNELDPELATIQRRYGDAFKVALKDALAGLTSEERSVLRLHFMDGLNLDRIAIVLGVSRATAGRRLLATRERAIEETNRILRERLSATDEELKSLLRLVRSDLGVSLTTLFRERSAVV